MKRQLSLSIALALLPVAPAALSGCATTRGAGEQGDDARLQSRVAKRIAADPDLRRFQIEVDATARVITLRGQVDDQNLANQAVRIALNTDGVERVESQLQVGRAGQDAPGDLGIRAAVGAKLLSDPEVVRTAIDVDVYNGVVYLSGIVADPKAKEAAERIASNVDGVVRVESDLRVSPEMAEPPPVEPQPPRLPDEPDMSEPDMSAPDMSEPDISEPSTDQPEMGPPEMPPPPSPTAPGEPDSPWSE